MIVWVLWSKLPDPARWEFGGIYRTAYAAERAFPHVDWPWHREDVTEIDANRNDVQFRLVRETIQE